MSDLILLIEDSADDALFMTRALAKSGASGTFQIVDDGRKAVDYLSGNGQYADRAAYPLPRFVLLDLKLPQLSGFDVLRWIRSQPALAGLIVVVLTSSNLATDIRECYLLGANSFLSKPPDPTDLVALIREVSNYWLKTNVGIAPFNGKNGTF